jgi:hypothetical protein
MKAKFIIGIVWLLVIVSLAFIPSTCDIPTPQQSFRLARLDDLFHRTVVQMTKEKLEKADFHILSRLIQQDLTMMRFNP